MASSQQTLLGHYTVKFVGNRTVDATTTYVIQVSTPKGEEWEMLKRYREIRELHEELRLQHGDALPAIPAKRLFGNQDPAFIASRQLGLQQYLQGVLELEPEPHTPALLYFLGDARRGDAGSQRCQTQQYQEILDNLSNRLLNLAVLPTPLAEDERQRRTDRMAAAAATALDVPVDLRLLRELHLVGEPLRFCEVTPERLAALKAGPAEISAVLSELVSKLDDALDEAKLSRHAEKLIVEFPDAKSAKTPL